MQILAQLSLSPGNNSWVLQVLGELDTQFEKAFKIEELWAALPTHGKAKDATTSAHGGELLKPHASLHTWMAVALVRVMGGQLKAAHILQMIDGSVALAVATLLSLVSLSSGNSGLGESAQADCNRLLVHSTRLLFELTTFDATFDEDACESFADLKRATAVFQRQNNDLIGAVIQLPVLETLIAVLRPELAAAEPPEEAARSLAVSQAVRSSLMMLHNLLLYSTEKSTQLRKHIAGSGFVTEVLDPFLSVTLERLQGQRAPPPSSRAERFSPAVNVRTALRIICVATHKVPAVLIIILCSGLHQVPYFATPLPEIFDVH